MDMIESYSIINCTKDNNKKNLIGQIYFIELQVNCMTFRI